MAKARHASKIDGYDVEHKDKLVFFCPGCQDTHEITVNCKDSWGFNQDFEKPTITPSILTNYYSYVFNKKMRCHSFVKEGLIEFLNDCTHELAGQTVELPCVDKKKPAFFADDKEQ